MIEAGNNDLLVNLSWKNRCIKLLEQDEEKSCHAKDLKGKTNHLLKEKKELEDNLKLIEEEIKKALKQLKDIGNDVDAEKPLSSSLLKLYSLITKLTFDIENPANELKGYIAGNSLKTFQFDTDEHSQQFIIDSLWNLIETQLKPSSEKM
ncbi:kinetochore protein Spc24-like [Argiope bruennichi]|uniref:Kinetochore protein Spc24 n=1 Tax=Argiope bruennichi TaxID=94029 RepID=A0A8T0EUH5_ARGBR|nr:kinetochore protein Spc24-like [Argiope bruennichi]KAF8781384.1 hypothetical protein HNY73_011784 [Argiope bruennichi]